jgi:hypothetical protein
MASSIRLGTPRLESFGRCVVLRAAQWALDGRSKHATVDEFRNFLAATATEMVDGARHGRKEAPLPFMIANKLDGAGSSYYTMGDRKYPKLATYFANIKATMSSVAALAGEHTIVVQMIAFSDAKWQLPRYLETMEEAGLQEMFLPILRSERDGRLWRSVPGRRWYSDQRGKTPGSQEVVLIHRKFVGGPARRAPMRPSAAFSAKSGTAAL